MISKRLRLAVLAQAILDLVVEPDVDDEEVDSAIMHLAKYPQLVKKLQKLKSKDAQKWAAELEKALGRKD